jgi:hypothetical protein
MNITYNVLSEMYEMKKNLCKEGPNPRSISEQWIPNPSRIIRSQIV